MKTQLRLRLAKILVINVGAVGTEVVKNLVLGGVNLIELLDLSVIKDADFGCQFFLPNDLLVEGQLKLPVILPQIKELNNRVNVTINTSALASIEPEYYGQFDLVIATELTYAEIVAVNNLTRTHGIPLYVSGMHGMFGYIFTDLIKQTSEATRVLGNVPRLPGTALNPKKTITEVDVDKAANKEHLTIVDEYSPLAVAFNLKELPNQLRKRQLKQLGGAVPMIFALLHYDRPTDPNAMPDKAQLAADATEKCRNLGLPELLVDATYTSMFSRQAFTEFAPVAAIIGGALAQDVIQFFGQKELRINNALIFDGHKQSMPIFTLY